MRKTHDNQHENAIECSEILAYKNTLPISIQTTYVRTPNDNVCPSMIVNGTIR